MIGIMPIHEALAAAQAEDKDLVLVTESAQPPIAKIIELAKHKYQLQQKAAENRKKNKAQEIKELQFTPFIGEGDLQTKLKRVFEFLNHGDKVRLTVDFRRGRQITKKEFGFEVLNKIFAATADIATVEMQPQFVGKKLITQLMPVKKSKVKAQAVTAAPGVSPQAKPSVSAPEPVAATTTTETA
jgi:translation initiation factor IF-3